MSLRSQMACCAMLALLVSTMVVCALRPAVPRTEKRYFMHLHPLMEDIGNSDEEPTLVSITEKTSLWLPRGSTDDNDEHLTFNSDLDPFWVHILRRRRFDSLEWSGCGGSWHPEWTETLYNADFPINTSMAELFYDLSHHTTCYFSSLSACGWYKRESMGDGIVNASVGPNREVYQHHQWIAHFVSALLSSPLSWSKETPRHLRPVGLLRPVATGTAAAAADESIQKWCSLHLAHYDTVCMQHITSILNGGRNGIGVDEGIPKGVFEAGFATLESFLSSEFHHFHFGVTQSPTLAGGADEETEIKLVIRMAFVVRNGAFDALAAHWRGSLPAYADRLTFYLGSRLNAKLGAAARSIEGSPQVETALVDEKVSSESQKASLVEPVPTAHHYISTEGHVRGTYRVVLLPPVTLKMAGNEHLESDAWYGLKPGDTLDTLLMFPLHLIRPLLSELHSNLDGASRVESAFYDVSTSVLVVLVKTVLTEAHFRNLSWNKNGAARGELVICELPFRFGWTPLSDMPHDANSYRILPHPVIRVGRRLAATGGNNTASKDGRGRCTASRCASTSFMRIDHQSSLERLLLSMVPTTPWVETETSSCTCHYWLRCSNTAGTTIPVPDAAMVFNVTSLGLICFGLLTSSLMRSAGRLFDAPSESCDVEKAAS